MAAMSSVLSIARDRASKPPLWLSARSSVFFIVLTVCLAIFTDVFFYALIIPVLPYALTSRAGLHEDELQRWTAILLASYSVALFIGSPIAGIYADRSSSRRWPLLLGLLALVGSTLFLAFGNSIGIFVLGRILQGISAAVVWSAGCALLVDTMGQRAGLAMGYVNAAMSLGLLVAPSIGGVLYIYAGYYAVYYVAFGITGLDIVMRLVMIEKKVARQWIKDDNGITRLIKEQATDGESSPQPSNLFAVSDGDNAAPAGNQSSPEHAPPDQRHNWKHVLHTLLKSRRLLAALYGLMVESSILNAFEAVLPLFVRNTFQWNSIAAGIAFLAPFLPGLVAPLAGWLSDKYGPKWLAFGALCANIPLLVSLRFVTDNSIQHKVLFCALLALLGTAFAFSSTSLMAEITYVIEDLNAAELGIFGENGAFGLGYGLYTMCFALGGAVGPLWAGFVVQNVGWPTYGWSFAIYSASGAVVVLLGVGNKRRSR